MGLMDKIKNMFTEEEEIEEEPIKKEVIQVEIPAAITKKEEKKEVVEPPKEVKEPIVQQPIKKTKQEEKFIFPVYFDDDDFQDMNKKMKEERKIKEEKKVFEEKKVIPKPVRETYKGRQPVVEEKKVFKPTPIISPVYGVLDKNYTKEDITTKKREETSRKISDIDLVRNKAFGTLEDEIVDSLDYKEEKPVHNNDMEEYRKKMDEVDFEDLLDGNLDDNLDELENKLSKAKPIKEEEALPKYSRSAKNKKIQTEEVNSDDLFDMIDTMYEEEK